VISEESVISEEAKRIHRRSFVIDCHSDILMDVVDGRARLAVEGPREPSQEGCAGLYSIPQFRRGGVTVQFCAIWTGIFGLDNRIQRAELAPYFLNRALAMAVQLHREIEANPDHLLLVSRAADVDRAKAEGKTGLLLAMEGGEPIGFDARLVEAFYRLGLRSMGLTWNNRNYLADGLRWVKKAGGLSPLGFEVLDEMERLGMLVDVAHLHPVGFWEVLEHVKKPILASHVRVDEAYLSDEQCRAIGQNGGVVAIIFYSMKSIDRILDQMEKVIALAGIDHVGCGSDFFGRANSPARLEDVGDYPHLTEAMVRRGYREEDIKKILGGNVRRLLQETLTSA